VTQSTPAEQLFFVMYLHQSDVSNTNEITLKGENIVPGRVKILGKFQERIVIVFCSWNSKSMEDWVDITDIHHDKCWYQDDCI
jgi:hypothetical protein